MEVAVATGPAIGCCCVWLISEWSVIMRLLHRHYQDKYFVELCKEMMAHAAFYGSAIAAFFGHQKDSGYAYAVASMWFAFATYCAYILTMRLKLLEESNGETEYSKESEVKHV